MNKAQEPKIPLSFTGQQLGIIYQGLAELPHKICAPVIGYIQQEVNKHNETQKEIKPEDKKI